VKPIAWKLPRELDALDGVGRIVAVTDDVPEARRPARRSAPVHVRHAVEYHAGILEAIRARDPEQARRADHIEQAQEDLRVYVLKARPPERSPSYPPCGRAVRAAATSVATSRSSISSNTSRSVDDLDDMDA
jgi:hypothetical protein